MKTSSLSGAYARLREIVALILAKLLQGKPPPLPVPRQLVAAPVVHPYRDSSVADEDRDRMLYNRGVEAINHFNKGCPRGIVLFPIVVVDHDAHGYRIRYFTKHRTMFMISGDRSWEEFCCPEALQKLADAKLITTGKWRQKWSKTRAQLNEWMIE